MSYGTKAHVQVSAVTLRELLHLVLDDPHAGHKLISVPKPPVSRGRASPKMLLELLGNLTQSVPFGTIAPRPQTLLVLGALLPVAAVVRSKSHPHRSKECKI